jgi:hypothetical protein
METDCNTVPRVWRARFRFFVPRRSARSEERGGNERSRAGHPRRDRVQLERWRCVGIFVTWLRAKTAVCEMRLRR